MTTSRSAYLELARRVRGQSILRYFESMKWRVVQRTERGVFSLLAPNGLFDGRQTRILVPVNETLSDYAEMVLRLVESLSVLETRPIDDIFAQLIASCDIFKTRVNSGDANEGSVPLDFFVPMVSGVRDLVAYSACAELSDNKVVKRKLKAAEKIAESCRFGQTELGSFVATFYLPLPEPPQREPELFPEAVPEDPPPLERKVLARLLRGIESAGQAAARKSEEPIIDAMETGLNANMCDVLSDMLALNPEAAWTFSGHLDPTWRSGPMELGHSGIRLTSNSIAVLDRASDALREVPELGEVEIFGLVYVLKYDRGIGSDRTIRLEWATGKSVYKVRTTLNANDYMAACDAHKEERYIRVAGRMVRVGRSWVLEDVRGFQVMPLGYEPN